MMKSLLTATMAGLFLLASLSCRADAKWAPSTLSAGAIQKINSTTTEYRQCLDQAIQQQAGSRLDAGTLTDLILKRCEDRLTAIRQVFAEEKVPPLIADRYLRMKRVQGTRDVLRTIISAQAQPHN